MGKVVVEFEKEKDTKNTTRYKEVGDENSHKVGTLYIKSNGVSELESPERVKVTIEKV